MIGVSRLASGLAACAIIHGCAVNPVEETDATFFSIQNDRSDTVMVEYTPHPVIGWSETVAPHTLADFMEYSGSDPENKPSKYLQTLVIRRKSDSALIIIQDPIRDSLWILEYPNPNYKKHIRFKLILPDPI